MIMDRIIIAACFWVPCVILSMPVTWFFTALTSEEHRDNVLGAMLIVGAIADVLPFVLFASWDFFSFSNTDIISLVIFGTGCGTGMVLYSAYALFWVAPSTNVNKPITPTTD
jgi:hypothetical protein